MFSLPAQDTLVFIIDSNKYINSGPDGTENIIDIIKNDFKNGTHIEPHRASLSERTTIAPYRQ